MFSATNKSAMASFAKLSTATIFICAILYCEDFSGFDRRRVVLLWDWFHPRGVQNLLHRVNPEAVWGRANGEHQNVVFGLAIKRHPGLVDVLVLGSVKNPSVVTPHTEVLGLRFTEEEHSRPALFIHGHLHELQLDFVGEEGARE